MNSIVVLNGSPRKNWNTAQLLKEAKRGAEDAGAGVEYFDLYDLNYTGCKSCLGCKRAGIDNPCKCYLKDELSPVLEKIYTADRLIIGSPIYYGEPTGILRMALERICFPAMSYNTYTSLLDRKVDVDVFLTMNVPFEFYKENYEARINDYFFVPFAFLGGKITIHPVCDTLQAKDYSKYELKCFDEKHKKEMHETQFPKDLEMAYRIGADIN